MTINPNKNRHYTFLLIGLLLSPFLSFSQQQEPKTVTIVVIAKEIKPQEEIIQLPADNMPILAPIFVKKTKKNVSSKPAAIVKTPSIVPKKREVVIANTIVKPAEKTTKERTSASAAKNTNSVINVSKELKQAGNGTITTIKAESDNKEVAKITHSSKVNSFSYIWIGIFLIVAGVVLGLLFGKPAFLISFVGIVFITLGMVV